MVVSLRPVSRSGRPLPRDVFYVDAVSGSDHNNGKTPATAWRTTDKVSSITYVPGASVLFKRGQTHVLNDTLRLRNFNDDTRRKKDLPVYIGAYGAATASLPKLSCWKILDPSGWAAHAANVWRIHINISIMHGCTMSGADGANIGRLLVDGDIKTARKAKLGDLAADWDYWCDGSHYLYVYSALNPASRASDIRASPNVRMIGIDPGINVRDIWFEGTGGNAADVASDTDIQWCVFHTIGGSLLSNGQRYGNAVQNFSGCARLTARHNLFFEVFDAALTCQGYPMKTPKSGWDDINFSDNWIARCAQGVEFWARYGEAQHAGKCPDGSGFRSVHARRLRLFDIGRGASRLGRLDYLVWVCFIEPQPIETPYFPIPVSVIEMRNCSDRLLFGPTPGDKPRGSVDFVLEPSTLSLPAGSRIAKGSTRKVEEWTEYVKDTGVGVGSTMRIEPANQALTPFKTIYARWQAAGKRARKGAQIKGS